MNPYFDDNKIIRLAARKAEATQTNQRKNKSDRKPIAGFFPALKATPVEIHNIEMEIIEMKDKE